MANVGDKYIIEITEKGLKALRYDRDECARLCPNHRKENSYE